MAMLRNFFLLIISQIVALFIVFKVYSAHNSAPYNNLRIFRNSSELAYFDFIFSRFKNNKIFLADIDVLGIFQKYGSTIDLPKKLAFAINEKDLNGFLQENFDGNFSCEIYLVNGIDSYEKERITSIYFECNYLTQIQISIFYTRNNYSWIGRDDREKSSFKPKWFGDVERLMSNAYTALTEAQISGYTILVPDNINRFLFDYKHSKMRVCDKSLADWNYNISNGTYKQNEEKNEKMLSGLSYIVSVLESMLKPYWIGSGTLLGWYRDCGFIPFTDDVDIAMRIEDHEGLFEVFLKNKITTLDIVFGFPDDSYEFHIRNKYYRFDIFFVYNLNATYQYYTYHNQFIKHKQLLPYIDDLCSAELINIKVLVPCDPIKYLSYMYGPIDDWKTPQAKNYTWPYLNLKQGERWSILRKRKAVKFYNKNGFVKYGKPPY